MSDKYLMYKHFYDEHLWGKKPLKKAVVRGFITKEEYKDITGEEYSDEKSSS